MRIAILSDIHDHDVQLSIALEMIDTQSIDQMLLLGDIVSGSSLRQLLEHFKHPVHLVFGNNDGDVRALSNFSGLYPQLDIHGAFGEVEIDHMRIAFFHMPQMAHPLARSGMYDVVCYGHTHISHSEIINNTLIINPGAIRPPLAEEHDSSYAIIDTTSPTTCEFIQIKR